MPNPSRGLGTIRIPQYFHPMKLTILGASAAVPTPERGLTAQILTVGNRNYLLDCGEGTQLQMTRFGIKRSKIRQVFISHLHGDHIFGLPGFITSLALNKRKEPLEIFGPTGISVFIKTALEISRAHQLTFSLKITEFDAEKEAVIFEDNQLTVTAIPLRHRIPCAGFLFQEKEKARHILPEKIDEHEIPFSEIKAIKAGADFTTKSGQVVENQVLTSPPDTPCRFFYATDTKVFDEILPKIFGVNLLYHEATFLHEKALEADFTGHSTARQAAEIAQKAGVGQLIIGHFSTRYVDLGELLAEARAVFPDTFLAIDGAVFGQKNNG